MVKIKTPFLGAAYYPEDWGEDQIPFDIAKMKEAGITCARIGEFAWRKMEPSRGMYDFGWLHHVVDELGKNGIAVIMGTPTATPPIWLSRMYPDVTDLDENGVRVKHGGRRHCCSSNPHYLEACDAIVHKMGEEFGDDPNIIGWQIDNEIYTGGSGCQCEYCVAKFHRDLAAKYGTVEKLNDAWNLNLFSQAYDSFDEIPSPVKAWHNPHIQLEWRASHYDADIRFIHRQAEILRRYTKAPIGTDMMPVNGMSYEKMNEKLDVVMFNHYNEPHNLPDVVFWFDSLRPLKDVPFWNTETATNWNGSVSIGQKLKPEGYCRVNSWLPIALGGESNSYWLWRQHWAGHELNHGYVISPEGRPSHVFGEVQRTSAEYDRASEFISGTKVRTDVAMHYTSEAVQLFDVQPIFDRNSYTWQLMRIHRQLTAAGCRPDVIGSAHSLDGYRLLVTPLAMSLEFEGMAERIKNFVRNGGVWIAGPMTDIRNSIGAHYTDRAMGMIEDMLGVRLDYSVPTDGAYLKAAWADGSEMPCRSWVECYSLGGGSESLANVTSGHSALVGESIISVHTFGKGKVILCGTLLEEADLDRLIKYALNESGAEHYEESGSVVVSPRVSHSASGFVICEVQDKEGWVELGVPVTDILTGERFDGRVPVEPYGVRVLVK